ncbi:MAG: alkyl sulfatase C-terminal domain-containing protein [Clostridiales bacterium]|nr:alkyl sulfatase C-terminal domain-containing protein [Clostridiales bacterium]
MVYKDNKNAYDFNFTGSIVIDTEKLKKQSFTINLRLTDGEDYLLKIHHGVLLYYKDVLSDDADLTISTPRNLSNCSG